MCLGIFFSCFTFTILYLVVIMILMIMYDDFLSPSRSNKEILEKLGENG